MGRSDKFTIPQENTSQSEAFQVSLFRTSIREDHDVCFVNCDDDISHNVVLSIICNDAWATWVDCSTNSNFTPDFYSDRLSTMMEAMAVNDVQEEVNSGKKKIILDREQANHGKIKSEFVEYVRENKLEETFKDLQLLVTTSEKPFCHSYSNYVSYMERIVSKHKTQISEYRKNHPGMKLIFFVFDSSVYYNYLMLDYENKELNIIAHEWFTDKRLLDLFKDADIDYLLWFTPYKRNDLDPLLPLAALIDLKKEVYTQEYNSELIVLPEQIDSLCRGDK